MKNLKIGDKFLKDGIAYIIDENEYGLCNGCEFINISGSECFDMMEEAKIPFCSSDKRCDGKHVVFKEVNND